MSRLGACGFGLVLSVFLLSFTNGQSAPTDQAAGRTKEKKSKHPRAETPAETAAPGGASRPAGPAFRIRAIHYDVLKSLVRPGDRVFSTCVRGPKDARWSPDLENASAKSEDREKGEGREKAGSRQKSNGREKASGQQSGRPRYPETAWNEDKFQQGVAALNAIDDPRLDKAIVLSSIEDLKANLSRLPKDITWLEYNSEPGMTPAAELENIEASVKTFAELAHAAGYKISWGPTNVMLRASDDGLLSLAQDVDGMTLQHQKVLQYEGLQAFIDLTRKRSEAIRKFNPACQIRVQVVIGRGTQEQLIEGCKAVSSMVSMFHVFTMREPEKEAVIIKALRPGS